MNRPSKIAAVVIVIVCCLSAGGKAYAAEDVNAFSRLLEKIKTYDFGQSREDLTQISDAIRMAGGKPEMKMIEKQLDDFLDANATYAAKQFVCEQLSIAGTEASAPALASMLTNEQYSDMARYALERIPGDAVDKTLREALGKADDNAKVGIINTLGVRGDRKAVGLLSELVSDANQTVAVAAVAALGRIDDPCATDSLAKAKDKTTGTLRTQVLDAYLQSAGRLAAKGQKEAASAIYKQLYAPAEPLPIRIAAVRGMIIVSGDKAGDTIVDVLKSGDKPMQTAVIAMLKDVAKTDIIKPASEQLPNLAAEQQIQLLAALADCKDRVALPAVLTAAKSTDASIRIAALDAIGTLGDGSTVDFLVQTAVATGGTEQKAAQENLYRLRGADIDQAVLKKLADAEPNVKVELILACDRRNITSAVPELMKAVKDAEEPVRIESIKALRNLAGEGNLAGLIDLQIAASGTDRSELEKTVAAVARQIATDKNPAEKILAVLPSAKDLDTRCSLLSVLGKIGDPAALPALREAVEDKEDKVKDAAVRALSDWPTAGPAADLLKIATTSENKVLKILALRGYIRLTGLESDRPAEETVKMYKEAMTLATEAAEKRMVLSGLANVKSIEALQMAASCLDDTDLKQEAEAAVVKIAEGTIKNHPQETRELLQKVLAGTTNDTVREQAQYLLKQDK